MFITRYTIKKEKKNSPSEYIYVNKERLKLFWEPAIHFNFHRLLISMNNQYPPLLTTRITLIILAPFFNFHMNRMV